MTAAVVLTGAPGAGKSVALQALAAQLARRGVSFGAIEAEQLVWGSPRLTVTEAAEQLTAVLVLQRRAGRRLFLVAAGMETAVELAEITSAIDADRLLVIGLSATSDTLAARLARREAIEGRGDESIIGRARCLAATAPNLSGIHRVIDTETRTIPEVTIAIVGEMETRDLLGPSRGASSILS